MTNAAVEAFRRTLSGSAPPPESDLALQALWWAGKNEWDRAHNCAQQHEGDPACDLVHAHLHRQEGDMANAAYWYRRAGKPVPSTALPVEWDDIAAGLFARP